MQLFTSFLSFVLDRFITPFPGSVVGELIFTLAFLAQFYIFSFIQISCLYVSITIDSSFQMVKHLESVPLSYSQMLIGLFSFVVYLLRKKMSTSFRPFCFLLRFTFFSYFDTTFYLDAKFCIIDHNTNHHMENFKIFYLYKEISSINYENIVVHFFTISFGNERLGGELTGKFCGAVQTYFRILPKSSDNSRLVHLSFQV